MNSLYPNLNICFYVSRKPKYVHMGLDELLFTLKDNDKIIAEIKDFTYDNWMSISHFAFHSCLTLSSGNLII